MHVIVAKPRIDGKSDYYDDRDLISVSLTLGTDGRIPATSHLVAIGLGYLLRITNRRWPILRARLASQSGHRHQQLLSHMQPQAQPNNAGLVVDVVEDAASTVLLFLDSDAPQGAGTDLRLWWFCLRNPVVRSLLLSRDDSQRIFVATKLILQRV